MTDVPPDRTDERPPADDRSPADDRPPADAGLRDETAPDRTSGPRSAVAVFVLLFVPVTALYAGPGDVTLVLPWAFVNATSISPQPVHVYTILEYFAAPQQSFARLPRSLQAWPLTLVLHLLAAGSAVGGWVLDREDRRVTGGLLVLAALASLWVTVGLAQRLGPTDGVAPLPIGAILTGFVALLFYRDALRAIGTLPAQE